MRAGWRLLQPPQAAHSAPGPLWTLPAVHPAYHLAPARCAAGRVDGLTHALPACCCPITVTGRVDLSYGYPQRYCSTQAGSSAQGSNATTWRDAQLGTSAHVASRQARGSSVRAHASSSTQAGSGSTQSDSSSPHPSSGSMQGGSNGTQASSGSRQGISNGTQGGSSRPHVTVVGGGAAGLTAAFFAAEQGAQVTVLERTREAGKKILMSGGTRCNVLPLEVNVSQDFFSESPASAVRAVFNSWPLAACRAWLEDPEEGVGLELVEEEETSKLFPASNSGRDVRDYLVAACVAKGVKMRYGASLEGLTPATQTPTDANSTHLNEPNQGPGKQVSSQPQGPQVNQGWVCHLADGTTHHTDRLVLSTGGMSFPAVGTDGTGHRLLAGLGVPLAATYPALTPLTGKHPGGSQLAGLSLYSVDLAAWLPGTKKPRKAARTGMLFTHKGYSGPSVLDVSHLAVMALTRGGARPVLRINWTGDTADMWEERLKAGGTMYVSTLLQRSGLRERLSDALCAELGLQTRRMCELKRDERAGLVQRLTAYELEYTGHEGYKKAEVTGGGVPLTQVCTRTLEAKALPGVHLAGEILDVFGRIGGFNFLWAWVSGRLAGRGAALAALADHQARQQQLQQQQEVAAATATGGQQPQQQ